MEVWVSWTSAKVFQWLGGGVICLRGLFTSGESFKNDFKDISLVAHKIQEKFSGEKASQGNKRMYQLWRKVWETQEIFKDDVRSHRNKIKKLKAQLEPNLATSVMGM